MGARWAVTSVTPLSVTSLLYIAITVTVIVVTEIIRGIDKKPTMDGHPSSSSEVPCLVIFVAALRSKNEEEQRGARAQLVPSQ
jgi:hypothetical protein